ncbi:DUF6193 family natural product biosynthesis protein [Amycolatopsis sp. FBCC-B4732]|uniref:DUF6193 family natural product biosynthesis protein n=1 Tax=Amycolatopsis sp. FBCC-B4732 TaxID=3079339 RepID=UPI001FF258F2|nr:DUF6193 family natural product biosynthesis protein [Amycolatopsis sp. FBCC-B4732]UOX85862.1 DUF6193 family natural product biosynthesis protein [Amycolatopsis sp. FBCC-B4732]
MEEVPHQDLIDAGGLEAVLRAACPDCAIDMTDAPGAFGGFAATVSRRDRAVSVMPLRRERLFRVRHKLRGSFLSRLSTAELAEVTGSAATWLGGATARELAAAWPFADFVAVADAYESGDRTEFTWQLYRAYPQFGLGEFIEAAMREPRLRRMHPFTSLFRMSFRPTADEYRVPGPWVRSVGDGRFTVVANRREEPDIAYGAVEAVRVCLAEVDRLGTAVIAPPGSGRDGRRRARPAP